MSIYPSTKRTLLERIQTGDEISWQEFYDRYSPVIRVIGTRYGLNSSECDDVVQNIMLKIFQKKLILKYQEQKARFRTYFHRITKSCIIDYMRAQAASSGGSNLPDIAEETENSDSVFMEEWRKQMLQEALDQLRVRVEPQTFLAFQLVALRGKKTAEAAEFLGMDPSNIYVAKNRCTNMLREIIQKLNQDDSELNLVWQELK